MIGTLACAPEWEVEADGASQGPWGGNLDVQEYCPGAIVTLMAEIAQIATKLRQAAGLPKEPTGTVANNGHGMLDKVKDAVS